MAELVADDMYQPQGVLVRLEDDTLGHVAAVRERGAAVARDAWPQLSTPSSKEKQTKGGKAGGNRGSKGSVGAAAREGSGAAAAPGPAGGIRIIHKSGSGARLAPRTKPKGAAAGGGRGSEGVSMEAQWGELRAAYGDAITGAVLADVGGDVGEAVQVLLVSGSHGVLADGACFGGCGWEVGLQGDDLLYSLHTAATTPQLRMCFDNLAYAIRIACSSYTLMCSPWHCEYAICGIILHSRACTSASPSLVPPQDQEALPLLLDDIVSRGVERVEREAEEEGARQAAAAAAVAERERERRFTPARQAARGQRCVVPGREKHLQLL